MLMLMSTTWPLPSHSDPFGLRIDAGAGPASFGEVAGVSEVSAPTVEIVSSILMSK